ncbi:MAG: hypothetical protein WBF48_00130 [Halarcobacter sp.]
MNTNNNKLQEHLHKYNPIKTASVFSSLLLNPKYHYHQYTLETIIKYCLSFCKGDLTPTTEFIKNIYNEIHNSISMMEEPVEDIFVSKLFFDNKSYKVQSGLWEGGIYSTQIILKIFEKQPNEDFFSEIKKQIKSILEVSNSIIEKNGIKCNELLKVSPVETLDDIDLVNIEELINNVKITFENFNLPLLQENSFSTLFNETLGNCTLERNPFYTVQNNVYFLFPTAITASIRRIAIEFFDSHNKKDLFIQQYAQTLSEELYKNRIFGKYDGMPIEFYTKEDISSFKFSENILEFDTNHFFHFIFVLDTLEDIESDWFNGFIQDEKYKFSDFIDSRIESAKQNILDKDINNKGCSFIVPCGVGRGFVLSSKFKASDNWFCESISNHDLITISNDLDCSPNLIWRIVEAQYKLKKDGTQILNFNGFLNLYGYVKENNYSIFVNESFDEELSTQPFNMITIGSDYNAYIREKVALDTDYTEVEGIDGETILVRKGFSDSLFSTNIKYYLYIPEKFDKKTFIIVYINYGYKIWLKQTINPNYDFTLQFKLFDALITWFSKMMFILNKYNIQIDENLKIWNIEYSLIKDISSLEKNINYTDIFNSFANTYNCSILDTKFNINMLKGFMFEENYSEQAMVSAFLNYLNLDQQSIDILLKEIFVNEDARLFHFFKAYKYREHFDISEKKPISIHKIDEQIIKLNLGWSCRKREEGNIVEGIDNCTKYLNSLMEVIWKSLQSKLKIIEREDLIKRLLINYEYSDKEKNIWGITFKSNLALHEDKDNVYQIAINKISEYNATSLSSRLVIEMAICECSVNCGKNVSKLDIQELLSLASFMHLIGGLSEAIKYEAITSRIVISSFGDILFEQSFNEMIMHKFGYMTNQKILDYESTKYSEKFKEKEYTKETNHLFEKEFMESYIDEFGYTIDDARLFLDFLEDYGLKINKLVYSITYNELIEQFDEDNKEVFIKILDSLIIHTRRDWTSIPKPFKSTDWQPWKFRRRYSIIMKPIIEIDSFEGTLIISPELVRTAYINLTRNIHEGHLEANQFQLKKMQKWIGNLVKEKGLSFNTKVKNKFIELGFNAREEIKLTEIFNKKMTKDFGDIDVFAWSEEKNIVYAIECKDLEMAKTQSEIARQLYEFKGQIRQINGKDKKDRLYKYHLRYEELKKDLDAIVKFTKVDKNFKLKVLVIFSNIVPMSFDTNRNFIEDIAFHSIDELDEII